MRGTNADQRRIWDLEDETTRLQRELETKRAQLFAAEAALTLEQEVSLGLRELVDSEREQAREGRDHLERAAGILRGLSDASKDGSATLFLDEHSTEELERWLQADKPAGFTRPTGPADPQPLTWWSEPAKAPVDPEHESD